MTLKELYEKAVNPIDDINVVKKLVDFYGTSDRMSFQGGGGMYEKLVKSPVVSDTTFVNQYQKEKFWIEYYNDWIKEVSSLTQSDLTQIQRKTGVDFTPLKSYLKQVKKVSSMEDIKQIKNSDVLAQNEMFSLELNKDWDFIKSKYVSGRREDGIEIKHRIYINAKMQDIHEIANLFRIKCEEKGLPYDFKFNNNERSTGRADTIVIYSSTELLPKYYDALKEIQRERPRLVARCGKPPMLTAHYDNWIGIADEPAPIFKVNYSYNEIRALIGEEAVEQVIYNNIIKHRITKVSLKDGSQKELKEVLKDKLAEVVVSDLRELKNKTSKEKLLTYKNIRRGITGQNIVDILKAIDRDKYKRNEKFSSNFNARTMIKGIDGKNYRVNLLTIDQTFRELLPFIIQIEPDFYNQVQETLKVKASQKGIDEKTFVFNTETKFDAYNKNKTLLDMLNTLTPRTENEIQEILRQKNIEISESNRIAIQNNKPVQKLLTKEDICPATITNRHGLKVDAWSIRTSSFTKLYKDVLEANDINIKKKYFTLLSYMRNHYKPTMEDVYNIVNISVNLKDKSSVNQDIIGTVTNFYRPILNRAVVINRYLHKGKTKSFSFLNEDVLKIVETMYQNSKNGVSKPSPIKQGMTKCRNCNNKPLNLHIKTATEIQEELAKRNQEIDTHNVYNAMVKGPQKSHIDKSKICPLSIISKSGKSLDVWNMPENVLINKCYAIFLENNKVEMQNMYTILKVANGHIQPTYDGAAKFLKFLNDETTVNPIKQSIVAEFKKMYRKELSESKVIAKYLNETKGNFEGVTEDDQLGVLVDLQNQQTVVNQKTSSTQK